MIESRGPSTRSAAAHPDDHRLLLGIFAALQLLDVISTNAALGRPGNHEFNPLIAALQAHLGAAWFAPKIVLAMLCFVALPRRRFARAATMVYVLVVLGNILAI